MQKWEYKLLFRGRAIKDFWTGAKPWNQDIEASLPALGEEGWELVAVVPRSSIVGTGAAGFTSDELWVFKRPKP